MKTTYTVHIVLGVIATAIVTLIVGVMSTDSPSSKSSDMFIGALMGFAIVGAPTILLPYLAKKEIEKYETKRTLKFNIINAVLFGGLAILSATPFAILAGIEIYFLYTLKTKRTNDKLV